MHPYKHYLSLIKNPAWKQISFLQWLNLVKPCKSLTMIQFSVKLISWFLVLDLLSDCISFTIHYMLDCFIFNNCIYIIIWRSRVNSCLTSQRIPHFYTTCKFTTDRLCGLVVRVPGYRSRGQGLIPGATRFSEKQWVWNGVHSVSWVQLRSYLKEKVASPV
jgi:hypothetical protein